MHFHTHILCTNRYLQQQIFPMHVCVGVRIYVYMYVCMYVYIHICISKNILKYIYIYIYIICANLHHQEQKSPTDWTMLAVHAFPFDRPAFCSAVQCVTVRCNGLRSGTVCCSAVVQCVAVRCACSSTTPHVGLYVHIYIFIYIYIGTYIQIYICLYIYIYMYIYI